MGGERAGWDFLAIPESDLDQLADLGDEGWELVTAGGTDGKRMLYLTRRQLDFRERVTLEQRTAYFSGRGLALEQSSGNAGS